MIHPILFVRAAVNVVAVQGQLWSKAYEDEVKSFAREQRRLAALEYNPTRRDRVAGELCDLALVIASPQLREAVREPIRLAVIELVRGKRPKSDTHLISDREY